MKSTGYMSTVEWNTGKSHDVHSTLEHAKAVCNRLLRNHAYLPCSIRGYVNRVSVEDNEGRIVFEKKPNNKFVPEWVAEE